jgi:hypothetical protein
MTAPHLVILGAGASRAAMPQGDRNGRQLPLMDDLVDTLGLRDMLSRAGVDPAIRNFEEIYSQLAAEAKHAACVAKIEKAVTDYFAPMQLPDEPTLYDLLVLSLREKDMIATFNWDPFLLQAVERLPRRVRSPQIRFIHGCVSVGYCALHDPVVFARVNGRCQRCGQPVTPSRLLYPVTQKDYNSDPLSLANWRDIRLALKNAYLLTIFGYGAPDTDVEAIELLHEGWGDDPRLGSVEVIDIQSEAAVRSKWARFIQHVPTDHFVVCKEFGAAWFARHPRRSCEAFWSTRMQAHPLPECRVPKSSDWNAHRAWSQPLIEQEARLSGMARA